jgi:hypothetical protein
MVHTTRLVPMLMLKNTKEDEMDGKDTTFMPKATLIPPKKNTLAMAPPMAKAPAKNQGQG